MKQFLAATCLLLLTGCNTTVATFVPSFWDDNQSRSIINTYQLTKHIDCDMPQNTQAQQIQRELEWFQLYSESKGFLQADVLQLIAPVQKTVNEWAERSRERDPSPAYCKIKRDLLQTQAELASRAVLGRF